MRNWVIGTSVGLVMLLVATFAAYTLSKSRTVQLAGELINRVDTTERVVALTFDDGPTEWTPEILNILATQGIPATFYLTALIWTVIQIKVQRSRAPVTRSAITPTPTAG